MSKSDETSENQKLESRYFKHDKYIFANIWADLVSYILILTVVGGSWYMYTNLDLIMYEIKEGNREYAFPTYTQLIPSLYYLSFLIIGHEIFRFFLAEKMEKHLTHRYKNEDPILIEIYKKKVATNIYKFLFYFLSTVFGFIVLKDLDFFPWSMLGNGEFKNLFIKGYPDLFYFEKPENFDFYYNLNLSFALFDGYLLITNPLQSDFLFMALHHLSTYSLIIFSFVSNFSHVGSIVYFSHYLGDVFSYIVRVCVHLNISDFYTAFSTFVFLVIFSYTRLFVFGDVIYQIYVGLDYTWTSIETNLVAFLLIIMLLNILWIVLITKKFIKYCCTGNIEEIYKFKINKQKER